MSTDLLAGLEDDTPAEAEDVSLDAIVDMGVIDGAEDDAEDDAPDAAPDTDDGDNETADAGPAAEAAAPVVPEPEPVPFAVKVWGQDYALPGAKFDPNTRAVSFADDKAFDRARQLLTKGREYETRGRQEMLAMRQELERVRNEPDPEKETARVYLEEWNRMMGMTPDDLYQFVQAAQMEWPRIQGRAERQYAERLMQQARTAQQPPEPDIETVVEDAQTGAAQFIQQSLGNEAWATDEVRAELTTLLQDPQMLNQFVYRSNRDVPEYGIRAGQWVADWGKAAGLVERFAKPYQRAATATQAATQRATSTQSVAKTNAASMARAKPTTPVKTVAKPSTNGAPKRPQDVVSEAMKVWREMQR